MAAQRRNIPDTPNPAADDTCEVQLFDAERVEAVRRAMKSSEVFQGLAEIFRALGDPTRVKILFALGAAELCVCDLAQVLGLSVSAVSHQLRLLRGMRLVKYRREGRMAYYSLDDEHVTQLMAQGLEHAEHRG